MRAQVGCELLDTLILLDLDHFFSIEPVVREEYIEQIHKNVQLAADGGVDLTMMHPLRLSLFFIICAIATLFDTELLDPVPAAEEWHLLSKAAASLGSLMDEPSIVGTKTMVTFHFLKQSTRHCTDFCGSF
jgi:hypothetical protein